MDTLRLIDSAILQAEEPLSCTNCGNALTGRESVLYFCGRRCQSSWREWQEICRATRSGVSHSTLSGVREDYPWHGEFPGEPDVRYPEANSSGRRDEELKVRKSFPISDGDLAWSLQLWLDNECNCAMCGYDIVQAVREAYNMLDYRRALPLEMSSRRTTPAAHWESLFVEGVRKLIELLNQRAAVGPS